jgi:hypothetical protein
VVVVELAEFVELGVTVVLELVGVAVDVGAAAGPEVSRPADPQPAQASANEASSGAASRRTVIGGRRERMLRR